MLSPERGSAGGAVGYPPSSGASWDKQPAKKRSAPAPAPDSASASRSLVEDPDEAFEAPWTLCPV